MDECIFPLQARWRKVATRRCRNCLAAYDKQTPPGGKFMCTYCGHVSRKPVLDAPNGAPPGGGPGRGAGWPLEWCSAFKCEDGCEKRQALGWLSAGLWITSWGLWLGSWPVRRGWGACKKLREDEKGEEGRRGERRDEAQMSKEERARRKAEERLQARLEREQLEAEEQKQRQEVARLVEERRRERDQKLQLQREGENRGSSKAFVCSSRAGQTSKAA
jgi:hypothetical protein